MLTKTKHFISTLERNKKQLSFTKLKLKGSYTKQYTKWISDIDFEANISKIGFKAFIQSFRLIINNPKNFLFIKLTTGYLEGFKPPWEIFRNGINPPFNQSECNFDLKEAMKWLLELKSRTRGIIPPYIYKRISDILTSKEMVLGDLTIIDDLLSDYGTIKWFRNDINKGYKIIGGKKYILLDNLVQSKSPVAKFVYIYEIPWEKRREYIPIDLAIVTNKRNPLPPSVYYYRDNWYKIFKSYKKDIKSKYESKYWLEVSKLGDLNSILAQIKLYKLIYNYSILRSVYMTEFYNSIYWFASKLNINGKNINFSNIHLDTMKTIIEKERNRKSKIQAYKFLTKLKTNKIPDKVKQLYKSRISQNAVTREELERRRLRGIDCPFFKGKIGEYVGYIASKVLIDIKKMEDCFITVSKKFGIDYEELVDMFRDIPANRLSMEMDEGSDAGSDNIIIYGDFKDEDRKKFDFFESKYIEDENKYKINIKYLKRLQIYMLIKIK